MILSSRGHQSVEEIVLVGVEVVLLSLLEGSLSLVNTLRVVVVVVRVDIDAAFAGDAAEWTC